MPRDELASVRPYLDDLADDDETTRMQASTAILLGLENASASTVDRAVDRLFTGLTSGRKSGRVGFSVTLAELLARALGAPGDGASEATLTFARVLELLRSRTQPKGKPAGPVSGVRWRAVGRWSDSDC